MKTAINHEAQKSIVIEDSLARILEIVSSIRPVFLKNELKFSKKAEKEKLYIYKKLFPEKVLGINKIQNDYNTILGHANLSKLEKADLDFILDLEKIGFSKSQYVAEMNILAQKEKNVNDGFFHFFVEETVYFTFLSTELRNIQYKLDTISPSNP